MFNGNQGNPFSATKEEGGGGVVRIVLRDLLDPQNVSSKKNSANPL